jgi:hypothetical protein
MSVHLLQGLEQDVEGFKIGSRRLSLADLKGFRNTALVVSFVRMTEKDVCLPCLCYECS